MLDLDGFKAVNDTHGHAAGDEALREVARRLSRSVRERDLVARLGGDEFVVVLTDLGGRSGAVQDSMERIAEALTEPIAFDGASVTLGAAMGVATFPADGGDAADLLAHADAACTPPRARRRLAAIASAAGRRSRHPDLRHSGALASREQCPAIPYTPAEYAAEARRMVDEGGVMVTSTHARSPARRRMRCRTSARSRRRSRRRSATR